MGLSQRDLDGIAGALPGGQWTARPPAPPPLPPGAPRGLADVELWLRGRLHNVEHRLGELETILLGGQWGSEPYMEWGPAEVHDEEGGVLWHLRATVQRHAEILKHHTYRPPDQRAPRGPI